MMSSASQGQRNPYKGIQDRAWAQVRLVAVDGTTFEVELIVDTGSPCAIVISSSLMNLVMHKPGPVANSNFGSITGGWLRVVIPDVGFDELVLGFASDAIVAEVKKDSPTFEGLLGLPLLRRLRYGGDADWFWILPAAAVP